MSFTKAQRIRAANISGIGFGGKCGAAAIAINEITFEGKGKLVGAFNKAFLRARHPIGHIAVLYKGKYYDADGKPKSWIDIEAWGMLDEHDSEHVRAAKKAGFAWDDIAASEVERKPINNSWIERNFDVSRLEDIRVALLEI